MTERRTNNSMVVITLGVYLGLLLVGGTAPLVFAHSATTRGFEIADEIEVNEDLDTKPDEGIAVAEAGPSGITAINRTGEFELPVNLAIHLILTAEEGDNALHPLQPNARVWAVPALPRNSIALVDHTTGILATHRPRSSIDPLAHDAK
jgi:hypothetical protein